MDVLNFIGGIAAIILALELVIAMLLVAGLAGGIWFGLRFAEKKTMPIFDKVNGYLALARRYERLGLGYAVKPLVIAYGLGTEIGITTMSLVERVRERQ